MEHLTKRHIGRILLDGRFLSQSDLDSALQEQKITDELLGQVLVRKRILNEEEINVLLLLQKHFGTIDDVVKVAAGERQLFGDLLVQSGHITENQLHRVIAEQQQTGEKLGEILLRLGLLNERQLQGFLLFQHNQETSNSTPLRLGELLVTTGHITREQLDDALNLQSSSGKKLGQVLVDEGHVRPILINYAVDLQKTLITSVLATIFSLGMIAASNAENLNNHNKNETQTIMHSALNEARDFSCLSTKEAELLRLVNEYREYHNLPPVANARSLNKVARLHAIDLVENRPAEGQDSRGLDCSLHSWSKNGSWTAGCYTQDHINANLMWDKPREISNFSYNGDGYENAYATSDSEVTPAKVLEAWKASPSHNAILLESGVWKGSNLLSLGVGIYKNHAVIWVGSQIDSLGAMQACSSVTS